MGMGDENVARMVLGEILELSGRRGILAQKRVDHNIRPAG